MPAPSNNNNQPIDKRKYHTASTFYLFAKQFIDENASTGRRFKTEAQGVEAAALRWNSLSKDDHEALHALFKAQRKEASASNDTRKYKIRNGSRRDCDYDPVNLGLLKKLPLKFERDTANLLQRWSWSYYGDRAGIEIERFLVVTVDTPSTATNLGAFRALAVVEFSLMDGIVDELSINVGGVLGGSGQARRTAIDRVLNWPSRAFGHSLGSATPAFYTLPGQVERVFNALIYDGGDDDDSSLTEAEKKFSLLRDLSSTDALIGAFETWTGRNAAKEIVTDAVGADPLSNARAIVDRILISFRRQQCNNTTDSE